MAQTHGPPHNVKISFLLHMLFFAYGGTRPLAGLEHVCSRLFNETISHLPTGWPQDYGPTNVGAMVKTVKTQQWENGKKL